MIKKIITESNIGELPTVAILYYFCLSCNGYRDIWIEGPPEQAVQKLTCKNCNQTIARGKIPEKLFKQLNSPSSQINRSIATEFVADQIRVLHEYFHQDRTEEGGICYPDPTLLICYNCKKYSFEAMNGSDENDTYIWLQCIFCKFQYGVSH